MECIVLESCISQMTALIISSEASNDIEGKSKMTGAVQPGMPDILATL